MGTTQSTRKITLVNDEKAGVIKLSESLAYRLRGQIEGQQAAAAAAAGPAAAPEPATVTPPPMPSPPMPSPPIPAVPLLPEPPSYPFSVPSQAPRESRDEAGDATPDTTASPPAVAPAVSDLVVTIPQEPSGTTHTPQSDVDIAIKAGPGPSLSQPGGTIPPWSIYAEEAHLMVMRLREEKEQEIKKLNEDWRDKMDSREQEFIKMARLSEDEISSSVKDVERLFVRASCLPVCQNQQEAVMRCYQDHPRKALCCAREVDAFAQCVDLARLQSVMKERVN